MTPELQAAWKQHVKACEEGYYPPAICATVIAVDAELERLRKVVEAARAHSREPRLNHFCKVCNAIAEYDKEAMG